jgi:hypothetical protein
MSAFNPLADIRKREGLKAHAEIKCKREFSLRGADWKQWRESGMATLIRAIGWVIGGFAAT